MFQQFVKLNMWNQFEITTNYNEFVTFKFTSVSNCREKKFFKISGLLLHLLTEVVISPEKNFWKLKSWNCYKTYQNLASKLSSLSNSNSPTSCIEEEKHFLNIKFIHETYNYSDNCKQIKRAIKLGKCCCSSPSPPPPFQCTLHSFFSVLPRYFNIFLRSLNCIHFQQFTEFLVNF